MAKRRHKGRDGIVPLARDEKRWNSAGWKVLKFSIIAFTLLGFAGSFAAYMGSGGITLNGQLIEGWRGVWLVTAACAFAGFLFGLVWFLILKTLALASK